MNALLEISYVSKIFKTKRGPYHALKDVHLKVNPGEFVSLIGHSGCGKSTLLSIVTGLVPPSTLMNPCFLRRSSSRNRIAS